MLQNRRNTRLATGGFAPAGWGRSPTYLLALLFALGSVACGEEEETRTLEPIQLGMTKDMAPIYEQDQTTLYEVKRAVPFPIRAPSDAELTSLQSQAVPPYPYKPWLYKGEVEVQITWTLSNLDEETHNVELLIDPWNEFARYWPGASVTNAQREEQMPNLSGIDVLYELPGLKDGRPSRRHGTITFEDMDELAIDYATAVNIIATAPPPDPSLDADENPAVGLVNHAFAVENRSYNDVVVQPYIPGVIAGLTGIDLGLRTYESANVAIEIVIEVVDKGSGKVVQRDENDPLLPEPTEFVTIGNGSYGM